MKTIYKIILLTSLLITSAKVVQAQITGTKPNQVELMKKFTGSWKGELGKDTIITGENVAFGAGLICNSQVVANGKTLNSVKQLFGYDKKNDRFIIAELIESSPVIEICETWFTSENTGEMIVINPDNVPVKYKFEFKTPDRIVQTAIIDNKVVKEITLTRTNTDLK